MCDNFFHNSELSRQKVLFENLQFLGNSNMLSDKKPFVQYIFCKMFSKNNFLNVSSCENILSEVIAFFAMLTKDSSSIIIISFIISEEKLNLLSLNRLINSYKF